MFSLIKVGEIFRPLTVMDLWPLILTFAVHMTISIIIGLIHMAMFSKKYKYKYTVLTMMILSNQVAVPILIVPSS